MTAQLLPFKTLVYDYCGLVLEGIAEDRLRKIVHSNAKQAGCQDLKEYERLIRSSGERFQQLVGQLTVNETYFFREPEQLQLLTEVLIPQVLAQKIDAEPVRILSAGCSSGEEPYSLVIALHELYGRRTAELFQIDAGDLDLTVLAKAQAGIYSEFSFRGVEDSIRQRYFTPQARGYELAEHVRKQVNFYQLNLLAEEYPVQLADYDIIFFRNVSIYFDLETRRFIHNKFNALMRQQSILLLGSSETMGNDLGVFELVEHAGQYFFIKGDAYRPVSSQALSWLQVPADNPRDADFMPLAAAHVEIAQSSEPVLAEALTESTEQASLTHAVMSFPLADLASIQQLVHDGEQQRALRLLESFPERSEERYAVCLLKSWLLLNMQAFSEADELLEEALTLESWSVDAMLMKGMIYKWQERLEEACQWFKKVIYTCPECWPAHYYLADILRNQQQLDSAMKSYQTVLRILSANPSAGKCLVWIPLPLAVADAVFLSQRHTAQLASTLQTIRVND